MINEELAPSQLNDSQLRTGKNFKGIAVAAHCSHWRQLLKHPQDAHLSNIAGMQNVTGAFEVIKDGRLEKTMSIGNHPDNKVRLVGIKAVAAHASASSGASSGLAGSSASSSASASSLAASTASLNFMAPANRPVKSPPLVSELMKNSHVGG